MNTYGVIYQVEPRESKVFFTKIIEAENDEQASIKARSTYGDYLMRLYRGLNIIIDNYTYDKP